ncbi:putative protein isoform X3 [Capsicum annuum]
MSIIANTKLCHVNEQPDVVVNCAALSFPRACEVDPTAAMAINVPFVLVKWLSSFSNGGSLLIHLSTDQGTKYFYKEDDETLPVNVYTSSKVAAEQFISANYSNFAILRSSIIYGPQTVSPVPKSLPVQVNTMNFTLFLQLSNFTKGLFCSLISSSRVADVSGLFSVGTSSSPLGVSMLHSVETAGSTEIYELLT